MPNAIHKFKDRDVKRVIRASQMAGLEIGALEVDPNTGRIKIIPREHNEVSGNELDRWVAKRQKNARPA